MSVHEALPVHPPASPVKSPESAERLIVVAQGWMLVAMAGPFTIGFFRGFVPAFVGGATQGRIKLQLPPMWDHVLLMVGVFISAAVLLAAALFRGRIVGNGDRSLGLGLAPIARLPVTIGLAIVIVAYGALFDYGIYRLKPDTFLQASSTPIWLSLFDILTVVILAPLGEELFFRGWLWTGLRTYWRALPTALLTTGMWLLMHLNANQILFLLFPALLISIARHASKSVRSTILIHAIYNLAVSVPVVALVIQMFKNQ